MAPFPKIGAGLAVFLIALGWSTPAEVSATAIPQWREGRFTDPSFFPIAVWLQDPRNARRYQAAGINLYVGLWKGPTDAQLETLAAAGMPVICDQTAAALTNRNRGVILGWMHGDEPDNAQPKSPFGYGPPVEPADVIRDYIRIRTADPARPVLLNLGQGVAWDNWGGRGVRTRHPEDYAEYLKGCDIASFDIYPVVHSSPEVAGKLEFVGRGVDRLLQWGGARKPAWACIECTHISNPAAKATPAQIQAEVWLAIAHGARGITYFVHEFKPKFIEATLLEDPETLRAVTEINTRVLRLAPVLNQGRPVAKDQLNCESGDIHFSALSFGGECFIIAVNPRSAPADAAFHVVSPETVSPKATVFFENRTVPIASGRIQDHFEPYAVHLYRWKMSKE
jgi:hypothetical protein